MTIRSAKDVIEVARRRGFGIRVDPGPPPMPRLIKPAGVDRSEATAALMETLKAWRLEIIEELLPKSEPTEEEKDDMELLREQEQWRQTQRMGA